MSALFSSATMKIIVPARDSHGRDISNDVKHRYKPHAARISGLIPPVIKGNFSVTQKI
jgi:hypothetical protein